MSVGQALGGIAGAVIGTFLPGVGWAIGAQIGIMVGGYIDPPKGPNIQGPRLADLKQQTSSYGLAVPRIYGSCAVSGNVVWIENNALKEVSTTSEQGGKGGGGGSEVTEYSYFATFALGLCEGPIEGVRRVWCNGKLIYDGGSTDIATFLASNAPPTGGGGFFGGLAEYAFDFFSALKGPGFTLYKGTDTQQPDPRMQATIGVADCPAYRGLAYMVFEDFALKDYGNTLVGAQFKVEVIASASTTQQVTTITHDFYCPHNNGLFSPVPFYIDQNVTVFAAPQWEASYPLTSKYLLYDCYPDGTLIYSGMVNCPGTSVPPQQRSESGRFLYSQDQVFSSGNFVGVSGFIYEAGDVYVGITGDPAECYLHASQGLGFEMTPIYIPGKSAVCTDGTYAYVAGTGGAFKFYLNWTTQTFDLVASGPALSGALVSVSRATIDKMTGQLCVMTENANGYYYKYANDLSSYETYATGLADTNQNNFHFYASGNLLFGAAGYVSTTPSARKLFTYYHQLRIISNDSVPLSSIVQAECLLSNLLTAGDLNTTSLTDAVTGYRVATVAAIRGGLEPLQGAWPFDVIQSGYKIKFVRRGAASNVATITSDLLDARPGNESPRFMLEQSREMDTQLPWRVEINHIDFSRDYDTGTQYAERLSTDSINIRTMELPIVLTADEAAQKAEILLYMYWLERSEFSFTLPPEYAYLEPGDVITVTTSTASHALRLIAIQYRPDGILECSARYNENATYTSTAVGNNTAIAPPSVIPYGGPVTYELLDVPVLLDEYSSPGFLVAMCGTASFWKGGNIYRSLDLGQNWNFSSGFVTQSKIGSANNSIPAPVTFSLIDKASALSVRMFGGSTLSSVTEAQMLAGSNHFAYGLNGRWEIIAAQTCTLESDGSYTLTDLLRGRFGTEWAASGHLAQDHLVLLDPNLVQMVTMNTSQIDLDYIYRGVPEGASLFDQADKTFAYRGVNLEPLSPVYASGYKNASNDWVLTWLRRTRIGGELRDSVDASLSETAELYDVEVYSDNTYSTLKRTFTGLTSATATYTSAQQTTDFGGVQSQLYLKIYQVSDVVGRGYPLNASVPYNSGLLSLVHFENTSWPDEVGGATSNVNAVLSSTRKFGDYGLYLAGAGRFNIAPINATAIADFTLEFWFQGATGTNLFEASSGTYWAGGNVRFNGGSVITGASTGNVTSPTHMALTRKGATVRAFIDGVMVGSGTSSASLNLSAVTLGYLPSLGNYGTGYFDEFRLMNSCLYETDFTPPAAAFSIPTGAY